MVYNVRVDNKILRLISKSEGDTTVGGNKGDIVNFEFDADWDIATQSGKPIKAIFRYGGACVARDVVDNQCEVPPIYRSSKFRFGVIVGETEEETPFLASTTIEVPSVLSARDYVPHGDMSDEQFYIGALKILKEAQELNARTEASANAASLAETEAKAARDDAKLSANRAEAVNLRAEEVAEMVMEVQKDADDARLSAQSASKSSYSAYQSAEQAENEANRAATVVEGAVSEAAKVATEVAIRVAAEEAATIAAEEATAIAAKEVERLVGELQVTQTTGDSPTAVMSQKATTELAEKITEHTALTFSPSIPETCPFEGYIRAETGLLNPSTSWRATDYIVVNENTTIKSESTYGANTIPTVAYYDVDKNFISGYTFETSGYLGFETTPPSNAKYARLSLLAAATSCSIHLEGWLKALTEDMLAQTEGDRADKVMSQKATTDYVSGYVPKVATRNLANFTYVNSYMGDNGELLLAPNNNHCATPEYVAVQGNTSYTFSCDPSSLSENISVAVCMYDSDKGYIKSTHWAVTEFFDGEAILTAENCCYIRLYIYNTGAVSVTDYRTLIPVKFQIELGDKTEYVSPLVLDPLLFDSRNTTSFNYSAYGLPVLEFEGDISAMDKDNAVTLSYKYGDRNGSCTLKWQGSSSLTYPKKNYTVKFDTAFEAKEGWGEQKKYCLKANYIDFSHSRNICSAKLWGGVVKSRAVPNTRLNALVNGGAIDGFPICVVINGEYKGIYTLNIPKDGWMFGMGSGTNEAILCANGHDVASGSVCLFRSEAQVTDDLEIEYATDEDNTDWIKTSVNRLIRACIDSDGTDLDTTIAQYLDWDSAIDYYIFSLITQNLDGVSKNYLLSTYDGTKWFFSAYDLDSTFGLYVNGKRFMPNDGSGDGYSQCVINSSHRVFELIKRYKSEELKARYKDLTEGFDGAWGKPLGEDRVYDTFVNFAGSIPKALFDEEVKLWTGLPSTSVNGVWQIIDHYRRTRKCLDPQIEAL